jgi:hypothetical protein
MTRSLCKKADRRQRADPIMLITPSHRDHWLRLDDCQWNGTNFVSDANIAFSEE